MRFVFVFACFVACVATAAPQSECFMLPERPLVRAKTGNTGAGGQIGHLELAQKQYVFVSRVRAPGSLPNTAGTALALRMLNERPPPAYVEPLTGLAFVRIPGGEFAMGSPVDEAGRQPDETLHRVRLSPFLLSSTEVTQAQWTKVMGSNPSWFRNAGADAPVEQVTWNEVQDFLSRLNARGAGRFRLPTEAEWEYAARAGSTTAYAFGDQLSTRQANYDGKRPLRVGSFAPNAWGLYDMHGNVWEWCADEHCPYPAGARTDPVNACGSRYKVIRGGSWHFGADSARSALRYTHEPHLRGFSIGFRVVRELER